MAKDMYNANLLLWLCNIALFISQFRFGDTTTHSSSYSNNNNVTCNESERRALLEFKGSLIDSASRLASWTTGEDCCSWHGITCNPRTGLRNPTQPSLGVYNYLINCLEGEINPSILNLEHLNYLDLSANGFFEIQIPTFLGSLKILRYLNLSSAGFRGEIPSHLGNLSNLQYMDIGELANRYIHNTLTAKSLKWISGLTSLISLDLSGTYITDSVDLSYSIDMLPFLSSLILRDCSIVELDGNSSLGPSPNMLENMTTLIELDLYANHFTSSSMLNSLCNNTNLLSLDLSWNHFQGSLLLCLANLTFLGEFDLAGNKFSGKIPSELVLEVV